MRLNSIVKDSFNRFGQISCNRIVKVKVVLKFDFILNITTLHQYLYRFLNTYTRTQKNKKKLETYLWLSHIIIIWQVFFLTFIWVLWPPKKSQLVAIKNILNSFESVFEDVPHGNKNKLNNMRVYLRSVCRSK